MYSGGVNISCVTSGTRRLAVKRASSDVGIVTSGTRRLAAKRASSDVGIVFDTSIHTKYKYM